MANGQDAVLDEINRLGGGGTAVAEPEDPVLAEIDKLGKTEAPTKSKEDFSEVKKPFATIPSPGGTLSQRADRLGALPMEPPVNTAAPHMVRGQFGQPIPPLPVEQQLESERYRESETAQRQKDEEQRQEAEGPAARVLEAGGKGLIQALGQVGPPQGGLIPQTLQQFRPVLQNPILPLEAAIPPSEKGAGAEFQRGLLKGVGELTTPENLALAGGMEALPAQVAVSAAGKVILGAGFTVPMAVGLAQQIPAMRDAIVHEDWQKASMIAGQAIPTILFTAEGLRNVYEGITQGVNITKQFMAARDEYARRAAERTTKLPEKAGGEPPAAAEPEAGPEPSPEPETPPEPEESPAPAKPKRKVAPKTAPPEEKLAVALENAAQEVRGEPEKAPEELPTEAPLSQKAEETKRRAPLPVGQQEDALKQSIAESEAISRDTSVPQEERDMATTRAAELKDRLAEVVPPAVQERKTARTELPQEPAPGELPTEAPQSKFGPSEEITPQEPKTSDITFETDKLGVRWAVNPEGVRVSIPRGVAAGDREQYAREKLAEQVDMRQGMKERAGGEPADLTAQIKEFSDIISDPNSSLEQREVAREMRGELRTKRRAQNKEELEGILGSMQAKVRAAADKHYEESIPLEAALEDAGNKLIELPTEAPTEEPRAPLDLFRETYRSKLAERLKDKAGTVGYNWRDKSPEAVSKFVDDIIGQAQVAKGAATADLWKNNEAFREAAKSIGITNPKQLRTLLTNPATSGELPTEAPAPTAMEKAPPGGFTEADKVAHPRANMVVREVRDREGRKLGEITEPHDGTPEGVMDAAQRASEKMWQEYGDASNIESQILATDESGKAKWAIPPNFSRMAEVGTDEARYILGDTSKPSEIGQQSYREAKARADEAALASRLESGTLPTEEVPADEQPTESADLGTEQQPVGEPGEGALEEVSPEDVSRTGEVGGTPSEGGGGGGTDAERLAGRDQQSRSGPPSGVGGREGEVPVSPERGRPARTGSESGQHITGQRAGNDYRITERDNIGAGGERTKYRANVAAIRTLKLIESEGRLATPAEQQILVKYVGWGGIASNQLFNSKTKGGKNWSEEHEELKNLLSEDEYRRARASTTNAHYTSLPVVQAMWDAARRLGFRDGAMLEPSAGVGHFLGVEPGDLASGTRRTAVELDPLSGRILKQLYQSADVRIQNYGDFKAPNGRFDIAMGNVPFGKIIVDDPAYNKHKLSIHNYFILKTLDKLRPGGVAALITSSHTLDSQDAKHRDLFAARADLIGAIRLPNTAFKGNAGTEVTTDILFFRKREVGEAPGGQSFKGLQEVTSPAGAKIPVNEYFARHPYMMLGDMELAGSMHRADEPALIPREGQNLAEELAKAVAKLPENAMGQRQVPDSVSDTASGDAIPDYKEMKQYGLKVQNGRVFRRIGDETIHEVDFPKKQIQTLKEMLGVRDVARELLQAEAKDHGQKELAALRQRLNNTYDRFKQKNGLIHSSKNEKAMHADPDLPLLLSLENYDKDTKTATKAAIFRQRVVTPTRTITTADNAKDSMLIAMSETGRLDFDRMAKLTGKPVAELQNDLKGQGLVFESPDGHWETSDRYLSGNVRKKLAEAEAAAAQNENFRANVDALKAVIPETVPPSKIFMKLGSPWIPNHVMKDFVGHILGLRDSRAVKLYHDEIGATYDLEVPYGIDPVLNRTKWGTARASAEWLLNQGLNLKATTIYDPLPDNKRVVNPKETAAAEQKLNDLHAELKRWTFEDSPYSQEVGDLFNEKLNANVDWQPDGSHLTFPGMNPEIQLRPYQKNAVWRAVTGDTNTLLAHEVGLGKTYIMGAIAMESRRLGLKKKPIIVFPTHLVPQNSADLMRLYPNANYLVADSDSFETMNRKEFLNRIATGDWDSVIIGDSQFAKMPPGAEAARATTNEMLDTAREKLEEAKEDGDRETVKVIETQIANFEAILDRYAAEEKKDDVTPFNELGVDQLIVDEAHRMKSLPFPTKMGRVRGVPQTKSQRSMDAYIKAQYITKMNNGNGVVFATGTPITNTVAEAWIMMKFLDEKMLQELGMQHFDAWAATFGQSVTKAEGSPEDPSKLRMVTRFSKFDNLEQLAKLFRRTADVKFADDKDVQLSRPAMVGGKMQAREVEPSPAILKYIESLVERAGMARGKKPAKGEDNMLVITGDGRKASLDLRMVDPSAADDPDSKLNQAAQDIASLYHASRDRKMTQLVGMDLREGAGGFDSYADLRGKLIAQGVPKNEIAFIQDYKTSARKQKLFADVNNGDIAIVIGHSDTLGVGVNVQKKLGALHILAPPYRPDQVEQVIGRGIRWGNENKEVLVRNYVTKKSFDETMWDVLTRKAEFIRSLMKGETDIADIGDLSKTSMNYAEMKAAASGDQRLFRKIELETTLNRLQMVHSAYKDQQFDNRTKMARLPESIATNRKLLDATRADRVTWDARPEKFAMTVGKKHFSDRKEAGAALNVALQGAFDKGKLLGEYGGFQIYSGLADQGGRTGYLRGQRSWDFKMGQGEANEKGETEPSPMGTIQSLERIGAGIERSESYIHEQIPKLMQELEDRQEQVNKPFEKQKELDKAKSELDKLNDELGYNNKTDKDQDDGDDEGPGGGEPPDDLTQSFLGLQNIYNRIERAMRKMRARRGSVEAAGDGAGIPPRPPETGIPMEAPEPPRRGAEPGEKAINIRLDKLNTSDEVLDLLRQVARQHSSRINAQRRGVLKDKDLKDRMEEVGLDPEKLSKLKKGTALNEAEMQVAIGIMLDKGEQVRAAAAKAKESNSTENLLNLQQLENEYIAIQAAVSGAKAESGRALRIQRMISEAFRSQNKSNYEKVLDALGGRKLSETMREKLLQIPEDDRIGLARFLRDTAKYKTSDKIMAYWINNILSGPGTVQRKLLGDAAMAALAFPMRGVRAMIDPAMAKLQGRPREFFARDTMAQSLAYVNALGEGVKKGAFQLWNGFDMSDLEELDIPRYQLPGGLATNWPTRLLSGATTMFKTMHKIAAIHGLAMRQALKEGLTGKEAAARATELVAEVPDWMDTAATKEAESLAMIERPDAFTRKLLALRDVAIPEGYPMAGMAPLKFVIPFVNIGVNIAKNAARYSPVGAARFASKEVREGPEGSTVIAQALIGSVIMAAMAAWYLQGNITGGAPKSAQDRDAWFRSGKQPFSFKVGNHWVSYLKGMGPVGLLASAVSGWGEAQRQTGGAPKSDEVGQVAGALLNGVRDQSFFRGLQNLDQAISEPDRFGAQWVSEIASGFVPFSGLDRAWANALDPEMRQPQGIYERIISGIPVMSRTVPPRLDVLGRPAVRRGSEGAQAFLASPIPEDKPQSDTDAELARLHDLGLKNIGFTSRFLTIQNTKIPMSRAEQNEYLAMRGSVLRGVLDEMFKSPDYAALSDQDKVSEAQEAIHEVENFSRDEMISRLVERRIGPEQGQQQPKQELPTEAPGVF